MAIFAEEDKNTKILAAPVILIYPMNDNYIVLIRKLDEFIRRYYKNLLIRGGILFLTVFILFYLLVNLLEYFAHFGITSRTIIFYSYLGVNAAILWWLIILPLFGLFRIGKVISREQAADIIGRHFPEVNDKLLNTLELKRIESELSPGTTDLIKASIEQRIQQLRPIPFKAAVDLKKNVKYLRFAAPVVIILLLIIIASPKVVTEPTSRIVRYNAYFEKEKPFTISILNDKLEAIQQEDFNLRVKIEGDEIPSEVYLVVNDLTYKLTKLSPVNFDYTFKNVQGNKKFFILADQYKSADYELKVLPKPIVLNFETILDYPSYTGKKDETLENTGDLVIPAGTKVTWKFNTRDTKNVFLRLGDEHEELEQGTSNAFIYTQKFLKSMIYSISAANEFMRNRDSLLYSISVIPDIYPSISIDKVQDSVYDKRLYFRGLIKDDYGFTKLEFHYEIKKEGSGDSLPGIAGITILPVSKESAQQQFFHYYDLDSLALNPGDQVEYFFEVWDNDGVNGPKSARSQKMVFKAPTLEDIDKKTESDNQKIKDELESSISEVKDLQKKINDLNRKLQDKQSINWQEKQQIQDLLDKQKSIQDKIEKIQKENKDKSNIEEQYKPVDEELIRKQEQLEKLFNEIMTDDMKKLFEELQKLMDNMDKEKVNEMLEKMKMDNKDIEKQLDRNLELFKQLEFEKKLQDAIDKLNDLKDKQDKLSEDTGNKDKDQNDLQERQKQLNDDFDKLRKDMDDLQEKNKQLEFPNKLDNTDQQEEDIQKEMTESMDQLQQGKKGKASQSQKSAAQKMKDLSDKLSQMQGDMYSEELGEDVNALREILENLLQLSFDQEALIGQTSGTSLIDPKYVQLIEEQKKIKDDLVMVEDSLWALSKRQAMIQPFITREIESINTNVDKTLDLLSQRRKGPATESQQYVMTSINNLALLLSEALEQMMNSMQMQASGQCTKGMPKPGGGKASMKSMRQMQQQLNKQIQQLKDGTGKIQGKQENNQNTSMSEQLARMAAEQEAIRRMMEQYQDELKEQGLDNDKDLKDIMDQMNKTETELVNKMITRQMIERQKDIETRLLQHEKAELQRELEEKRESHEGKDFNLSNPNQFLEYNKLKSREVELLKTVPADFRPFYKNKVNEYFYNFEIK
jgi:hypothetical protein